MLNALYSAGYYYHAWVLPRVIVGLLLFVVFCMFVSANRSARLGRGYCGVSPLLLLPDLAICCLVYWGLSFLVDW